MHARSLSWTILVAGVTVGALTWWAMRPVATPTTTLEPSTVESTSTHVPTANLDLAADSLAPSRALVQDAQASVADGSVKPSASDASDRLSILVIDRATRAPLEGMGVQLQWGPLIYYSYSSLTPSYAEAQFTDAQGRVYHQGNIYQRSTRIVAWDPEGHAGSAFCTISDIDQLRKTPIVLELSPDNDFVLWMRIVDEETGAPIAGVRDTVGIEMDLPTKQLLPPVFRFPARGEPNGLSDAEGLLLISGAAWMHHEIELAVPGHATVHVVPEKGHASAGKAMLIKTPRSASLRVHVVDTAGLPVRDCKVTLYAESKQDDDSQLSSGRWPGITDASGYALVADLPPRMELRGETSGVFNYRIPARLKLEPGEVRNIEWVVAGGVTLRGTLSDQTGAPISDCEIWLMRTIHERAGYFDSDSRQPDRRARTDASGRFVFAGTAPGHFWIGPGRLTYNPEHLRADVAPIASVVDVVARAQMDVELQAARGLYVRGYVIPPSDNELLAGVVVVEDPARGITMRSPWNADGTFSVGPLMSGLQTVIAQSPSVHAPSVPISVDAGTEEVALSLREGATIAGHAFDVNGAQVQCSIVLTRHASSPSAPQTTQQSMTGEFSFTGLELGTYDIAAWSGRVQLVVLSGIELAEGASIDELVLRLMPAGHLRVRSEVLMRHGELQLEQNGVRIASADFLGSGSHTFVSPPGRVHVRLRNTESSEQLERMIDVEAGKITDLTFEGKGR